MYLQQPAPAPPPLRHLPYRSPAMLVPRLQCSPECSSVLAVQAHVPRCPGVSLSGALPRTTGTVRGWHAAQLARTSQAACRQLTEAARTSARHRQRIHEYEPDRVDPAAGNCCSRAFHVPRLDSTVYTAVLPGTPGRGDSAWPGVYLLGIPRYIEYSICMPVHVLPGPRSQLAVTPVRQVILHRSNRLNSQFRVRNSDF